MGLLAGSRGWLDGMLQQAAASGNVIVYRRKADASEIVLTGLAWAERGGDLVMSPNGVGPTKITSDRDYLIPRGALPADPEEYDRITETIGGQRVTYELRKSAGEPAWRWTDSKQTTVRCRTKEVKREPVN